MLTTCFLAALFHGIVILGVTFSAAKSDAKAVRTRRRWRWSSSTIEGPAGGDKNPNARHIAQRAPSSGPGTCRMAERTLDTEIVLGAGRPARKPRRRGSLRAATGCRGPWAMMQLVATHAPAVKILYFAAATAAKEASPVPELLEKKPDLGMTPNDDGIELHMRGESKQQLWIAADTRESDVAVYLDSWRRKIERVGTMNFPDVARREKLSGTPVIEVTIGADGALLKTVVRRSSGHAEIDEAAMRILKLAAPYDPFSSALGAKHDEIRIAYEWEFLGGSPQGSSVFYADPSTPGARPGACRLLDPTLNVRGRPPHERFGLSGRTSC